MYNRKNEIKLSSKTKWNIYYYYTQKRNGIYVARAHT